MLATGQPADWRQWVGASIANPASSASARLCPGHRHEIGLPRVLPMAGRLAACERVQSGWRQAAACVSA